MLSFGRLHDSARDVITRRLDAAFSAQRRSRPRRDGLASGSDGHLQPCQMHIEVSGGNQWSVRISFVKEREKNKFKNRRHLRDMRLLEKNH